MSERRKPQPVGTLVASGGGHLDAQDAPDPGCRDTHGDQGGHAHRSVAKTVDGIAPNLTIAARAKLGARQSMRHASGGRGSWSILGTSRPGSLVACYGYPLVEGTSIKRIVALTGLSTGQACRIPGFDGPHRRWWALLMGSEVPGSPRA